MNNPLREILSTINSSAGRRVSFNYISLLLIQATNLVLPLVTFPYLIRVIGTEKFGLVVFAQSICLILYVFVDYGFSLSATRRIAMERDDKSKMSKTFSTVLSVKFAIAVVLFLIYFLSSFFVPKLRDEQEVFLLSYLIIFGQAIFPDWFFQGIEKMKIMAIISLIAKAVFTILIFLIITEKSDYRLVPLLQGLGYIFAGALSLFLARRFVYITRPKLMLSKELLKESFSLFASNLASRVINNIPIVLLGILVNDAYVGVYSSMEKLINTAKGVFVSLYQALYPWLAQQTFKKQLWYIKKMVPIVFILAILVMTPFLIFGQTILDLLYKDDLISANGHFLYILAFNILAGSLYMLFVMHYFPARGNFIARLKIISYTAIVSIILGVFLVEKMELPGAIYTSVSIEFLLLLLSLFFFMKEKRTLTKNGVILKEESIG